MRNSALDVRGIPRSIGTIPDRSQSVLEGLPAVLKGFRGVRRGRAPTNPAEHDDPRPVACLVSGEDPLDPSGPFGFAQEFLDPALVEAGETLQFIVPIP